METKTTEVTTGVDKKIDTAALVYDTLQKYKEPKYAADSLGWTIAKLRKTAKAYGIPMNIGMMQSDDVAVASAFDNKITTFISEIVPKELPEKIKEIKAKAATDDLLNYIVRTAVDFTISGFHVQARNDKAADKIKKFNTQYDMDAVVKKMVYDLVETDTLALGWNNRFPNIDYVSALDPNTHRYIPKGTSIRGVPQFVAYRLKDKSAIKKMLDEIKVAVRKTKIWKSIDFEEKKWVKVNLEKEPIIIRTIKGHRDRVMTPSAVSILQWLALRKQLSDSYQVVAYYTKKMVQHIKKGDPEYGKNAISLLQDKSSKPATQTECDAILAKWQEKDDAVTMVTGPHYTISFIAPDQKYLEGKALTVPEKVIIRWAGLIAVASEEGNTYAGGSIELKPLKASVVGRRATVTRVLEEFYRRALDEDVDIMWNNLVLMETAQVIELMQAFMLNGGSYKTWMETFGFHYDYELRIHKEEAGNHKDHWPLFEKSQGLLSEKKNGKKDEGRPTKSDSKPTQEKEIKTERK